jgi:spore coat polysaccharide biosynthesis protein SpsF
MKPRTIAIIQARMGATRLPGKVLCDIAGQPMLVRVVERVRRANLLDGFIVATTTEVQDVAIAELCQGRGYPCFRGSHHDVLDRYYRAARQMSAEVVVRITADCPVIDPQLIDETVQLVKSSIVNRKSENDFAANRLPPPWVRTYPIGLDVEVCTFAALEKAWKEAVEPYQREHVLSYLYEGVVFETESHSLNTVHCILKTGSTPRGFHVALLDHDPDYGAQRWTVDTPEDLELIRQVYGRFGGRDDFGWQEILALFEREPELAKLNARIQAKSLKDK